MAYAEQPNIIVDFDINAELVFISIKNLSDQPALNVMIKPSTAIKGLDGKKNISSLTIFKEIRYFAPNKEIRVFVDSYNSFFDHLKETVIRFTISYKDETGKSFRKTIEHDLAIYKDLIYFIQKN